MFSSNVSNDRPTVFDDVALLERWRASDPSTLERLYQQFSKISLRFLITKTRDEHEAEDLLHDTFILLGKLGPPTGDPSKICLCAYILTVARNVFLNHLRGRCRRLRRELDFTTTRLGDLDAGLSSVLRAGEQACAFLESLHALSIDDQTMLELKYFEQLKSAEIAQVLGIPTTAMPGRMMRAKAHLRQRLFGPGTGLATEQDRKIERWAAQAVAALRHLQRESQT